MLGFRIQVAFSSFCASQSASTPFPLHFHMPRVSVVSVSLSTSHYSLASSFSWLLSESLLPLGHRASVQLSHLKQRHAESRGLTPPYSVPWRTTSCTSNTLLRDEQFQGKILIFPNFNISDLRAYLLGWVGCRWSFFQSLFSRLQCEHFIQGRFMAQVALSFLLLEESRSIWTRRAPAVFSILLRLDSEYMSPRCGSLCQDSSLERPLRGFSDLQTPRGWTNPRPTT